MKRFFTISLTVILLMGLFACESANQGTGSKEESSAETQSQAESSAAISDPVPDKSEPVSDEESSTPLYDETTAMPSVYGCTRIEGGIFVILGTCEQGAVITASTPSKTVVTQSDHGYFSARIDSRSTNVEVKLTAEAEGKNISEQLVYNAVPREVDSSQWKLIAGSNYQFHIELTLPDYLRNNLFSKSQIQSLTKKLADRRQRVAAASPDTEIIYLLIPSPASVYPETMPDKYVPKDNESRYNQVVNAVTDAGIKVIDLREVFASHKNDERKLYWKTDSHWTDYGAFIAYTELFNYISAKHPECAPRQEGDFNWNDSYYYGGDISHYLEYYNGKHVVDGVYPKEALMQEYNTYRTFNIDVPDSILNIQRYVGEKILTYNVATTQYSNTVSTNRTELPSALVFRDSYSTMMYDILAERFDTTYYNGMWDYTLDMNKIRANKPEYIIYIMVERNLGSVFS